VLEFDFLLKCCSFYLTKEDIFITIALVKAKQLIHD